LRGALDCHVGVTRAPSRLALRGVLDYQIGLTRPSRRARVDSGTVRRHATVTPGALWTPGLHVGATPARATSSWGQGARLSRGCHAAVTSAAVTPRRSIRIASGTWS